MADAKLTLNVVVTLKDEPDITAQDKETNIKQLLEEKVNSVVGVYDYGITINGTLASTESSTVNIAASKPDYEG